MIFKRIVVVLLILVAVTSCYKLNGPEKPKNLISKDKMVDILIDIRLMSAATGKNQNILFSNDIKSYKYIYEKYNIDSLQFALSNSYYAFRVDDYDEIYAEVQDSLQSLKKTFEELNEIEIREKATQDSLKMVAKQDSLAVTTKLDSLNLKRRNDSLTQVLLETKNNEGLIKPVSDTDLPNE